MTRFTPGMRITSSLVFPSIVVLIYYWTREMFFDKDSSLRFLKSVHNDRAWPEGQQLNKETFIRETVMISHDGASHPSDLFGQDQPNSSDGSLKQGGFGTHDPGPTGPVRLPATSRTASPEEPEAVPHVLHQLWKTEYVHLSMSKWIQSWSDRNPGWTRVLWTHETLKNFIAQEFPEHLSMYSSYRMDISRADAARYFILYKYGGVYADLDLECLRPVDIVDKHPCILVEEPKVVATLLYDRIQPFTGNTFMACRRGHPFLKLLLEELPLTRHERSVLDSTGPFLLERVLAKYLSLSPDSNSFPRQDRLYVAPEHYFLPTYDNDTRSLLIKKCAMLGESRPMAAGESGSAKVLEKTQIEDCKSLIERNYTSTIGSDSRTVHHWVHTYWYPEKYSAVKDNTTVGYGDIIPGAIMAEKFMQQRRGRR